MLIEGLVSLLLLLPNTSVKHSQALASPMPDRCSADSLEYWEDFYEDRRSTYDTLYGYEVRK